MTIWPFLVFNATIESLFVWTMVGVEDAVIVGVIFCDKLIFVSELEGNNEHADNRMDAIVINTRDLLFIIVSILAKLVFFCHHY